MQTKIAKNVTIIKQFFVLGAGAGQGAQRTWVSEARPGRGARREPLAGVGHDSRDLDHL